MGKIFKETTWDIKIKKHNEILPFMVERSYAYPNENIKKIICIGEKITVIEKDLAFSTLLFEFQKITSKEKVFRGFQKIDELYPGYRRKGKEINEINALKLFEKQGAAYFNANNPMEFIANAQHFGLPTRLVDFTKNPFIALFFAMYSQLEDGKDYCYILMSDYENNIVLDELPVFDSTKSNNETHCYNYYKKIEQINKHMYNYYCGTHFEEKHTASEERRINEVREKNIDGKYIGISAKESKERQTIVFVEPNLTNDRVRNQQGLFMYPYSDDIDEHISILKNNTRILAIHKNYREDILKYLETIGISEYKLMPDLGSICREIIRELNGR